MKRHFTRIAALTLFVTTFAVGSARAQNPANLRVTVPFDFLVGAEKLPAGDYVVRAQDSRTAMKIQSLDENGAAYFLIHPVQGRSIQNGSRLVFHKYGDQYFLSQVWIAGRANGEELNRTNSERNLRKEIARRAGQPETVAVTVRAN
jgi:hypothetical protein